MANIILLDTGYLSNNTLTELTQESVSNRAGWNGGTTVNSFTLKLNSLSLASNVKVENKPIIAVQDETATTLVSSNNRVLTLTSILAKNDSTSGYNINQLYQFMRLERTDGIKLLYVDSTSDTYKTIIEILGTENVNGNFAAASPTTTNGTVSTTTPYLIGRVKINNITDNPSDKSFWKINFTFELTK